MKQTILESNIAKIITPSVENLGYNIVRVMIADIDGNYTLQIMVEPADGSIMNVSDCAKVSHTISLLLEVEDPIDKAYHLEVSSPGIDRPLIKPDDFIKYIGFDAKIEISVRVNNRRRFRGKIVNADEDQVVILCDSEEHKIEYNNIDKAKLVLTNELFKLYEKQF